MISRLDEKLSNLDKSEHEVSRWQDELAVLHEEFEKAESICQQEYAPDVDTLEKQKKDAQVCLNQIFKTFFRKHFNRVLYSFSPFTYIMTAIGTFCLDYQCHV